MSRGVVELRIAATARRRGASRLQEWPDVSPAEASLEALVRDAQPFKDAAGWLLSGGEPTLRPDLPDLLGALSANGAPQLGIATDGLSLAAEAVVRDLARAGLKRVRVSFHCARPDAHDWLMGAPGAARRAARALRACVAGGLEVEAEAIVTRPTMPYLAETMEVLARHGVGAVHLRLFAPRDGSVADVVALSPRLGLLEPYLETAASVAATAGVRLALHGFPRCAAGQAASCCVPVGAERWVFPQEGGWPAWARRFADPAGSAACGRCPGPPECAGAPANYVEAFGWTELDSVPTEAAAGAHASRPPRSPLPPAPVAPPPRAGRDPATRVAFSVTQAARGPLDADPLAGVPSASVPESIRVAFGGPSRVRCPDCGDAGPREPEPTRAIRIRLARTAQEGARTLRVASAASLAHPEAADLLQETTRLSFERVEIAGEGSALDEMTDGELARLRTIDRADVALYGPDAQRHEEHMGRKGAFEAALRGLRRLNELTGVAVGGYAVLHDAEPVAEFTAAWNRGALPGPHEFRLSPRGASLDALADAARRLPPGPARDALARVLPPCLLERPEDLPVPAPRERGWGLGRNEDLPRSGSDRLGSYGACPHENECAAAARCPGLAVGWSADGIRPLARAEAASA